MSAFGGKADMTFCGNLLSRSLLGVKRTCLLALQMSAYDPKRGQKHDKLIIERMGDYVDFIVGTRLICLKSKFFVSAIQWTCGYVLVAKSSSEGSQRRSDLCRSAPWRPSVTPIRSKIPKLIDGGTGARRTFELDVAAGISNFLPDLPTPTLGINGAYLGPTIRARAGDRVTIRVKNNMAEPTALHWHGLHVPARFDGGPHQVIEPGKVWEPSFDIKQKASLCWYHSHMLEQTGEQVLRGLAGLFLIEDDESLALRLPSDYGIDDIPLIIQDRRFNADGSFEYMSNMGDAEVGYQGNVILVNGTIAPHLELRRQRTRLRILNGSNARIYLLGRDDAADLVVIGSDGSLLERPVLHASGKTGTRGTDRITGGHAARTYDHIDELPGYRQCDEAGRQ